MSIEDRAKELLARPRFRMGFTAFHLSLVAKGFKTQNRIPFNPDKPPPTKYETGMILWLTCPHWHHPGTRYRHLPPHIWDEHTRILRYADGRATTPFDLVIRMPWRSRKRKYMPYWGCVVMVELLSCEQQRLHDITAEDAIAEAVEHCKLNAVPPTVADLRIARYAAIWNILHGRGNWDFNPIVRRFQFRLIEPAVSQRMRELSILPPDKKETVPCPSSDSSVVDAPAAT